MTCRIDHLVVTAPSLAAGGAFVAERLGVMPRAGGAHPRMGTHNLLLRVGDAIYLEVIAIDPAAPAPSRPRWFGLDAPSSPRLAGWVARTDDIRRAAASSSQALGAIEPMTRGTLSWLITIPDDGLPPLDGVAPALIAWHAPEPPARGMSDSGCRLAALDLVHPDPRRVNALLAELDVDEPDVSLSVREAPVAALIARFDTPRGSRTIGSA